MKIEELVKAYGKPFSEMLGIKLKSGKNEEIVKWFLASILYAKPIRESSATKTYFCFLKHGVTSARKILETGWHGLVDILDEGGYTRYDFSTADKLLEVFGNLQKLYKGNLKLLHEKAKDSEDLEEKIKSLGKGIGDTTVSIFLRDMRYIWEKANPKPSPLVKLAMKKLKIKDLKEFARRKKLDLVRLETALLRYAKDFLRKGKKL
ncbi:MAG: hypothetical protein ACP5O8_00965 [Candidatus Aenigmatarchaeota archaeon]